MSTKAKNGPSGLNNRQNRLVLSMDAGGPRAALFAHALIQQIKKTSASFAPDMVVGVSGGAIAASALAFGLDLDENSRTICFGHRRSGVLQTIFDGNLKTSCLEKVLGDRKMGESKVDLGILTCDVSGNARMFTSWNDAKYNVTNVVDASTAAPVYFPPVLVDDTYYVDGGVVDCDPSLAAIACAIKRYPNDNIFVLSIGTRVLTNTGDLSEVTKHKYGLVQWYKAGLFALLTKQNWEADRVLIPRLLGGPNRYLRVICSVETDMDEVEAAAELVKQDIASVWQERGTEIIAFIRNA